jgi:hypothetical protein
MDFRLASQCTSFVSPGSSPDYSEILLRPRLFLYSQQIPRQSSVCTATHSFLRIRCQQRPGLSACPRVARRQARSSQRFMNNPG